MKLLIIEDSLALVDRMKSFLGKHYVIDAVHSGEDGLAQAEAVQYTTIILDLGLPDMPGLAVCQKLRALHITTPILVLTGIDNLKSRVELLDSGADDYLTKPFNGAELQARLSALARRQMRPFVSEVIKYKDLEIDTRQRLVRRASVDIPLRRKEFDILHYLITNHGRAVSRQMIIDHVWEVDRDNWHNTVDVHIKHLRDKVDRPFSYPLIKTAYGIGYMVEDTAH